MWVAGLTRLSISYLKVLSTLIRVTHYPLPWDMMLLAKLECITWTSNSGDHLGLSSSGMSQWKYWILNNRLDYDGLATNQAPNSSRTREWEISQALSIKILPLFSAGVITSGGSVWVLQRILGTTSGIFLRSPPTKSVFGGWITRFMPLFFYFRQDETSEIQKRTWLEYPDYKVSTLSDFSLSSEELGWAFAMHFGHLEDRNGPRIRLLFCLEILWEWIHIYKLRLSLGHPCYPITVRLSGGLSWFNRRDQGRYQYLYLLAMIGKSIYRCSQSLLNAIPPTSISLRTGPSSPVHRESMRSFSERAILVYNIHIVKIFLSDFIKLWRWPRRISQYCSALISCRLLVHEQYEFCMQATMIVN